jgi:membrane protein
MSVRNSVNGAKWVGGFAVYLVVSGTAAASIDDGIQELLAAAIAAPFMAGFLMWSGRLLSANRLTWAELLPYGIIGGTLLSAYQLGASVYAPHAFNTYSARYGVIGIVLAMVSSLFGFMVVLVGSTVLGREVRQELDNIKAGVRPSEDEIRKQWDIVMSAARERRAMMQAWIERHRR